jgi:phage recombination protein Bet
MENNLVSVKKEFTQEEILLIRQQIAPKATDAELKMFLYQCQRSGLDPLLRQIYAIHRKQGGTEKMTIQTSIDGFRVIAERSGVYAGQDKPLFGEGIEITYNTTEWQNGQRVDTPKKRWVPEYAEVTVYKFHGQQRYAAATGIAYWEEYYPGASMGAMWHKMPHTMLAKCAESVALRKAFPQDLSGLYTSEEMQQQTEDVTPTEVVTAPKETNSLPELKTGTRRYNDTVEKLRKREVTVDKVKQFFTLTEEMETALRTIEKTALIPEKAELNN